jgi:hypothetical protein
LTAFWSTLASLATFSNGFRSTTHSKSPAVMVNLGPPPISHGLRAGSGITKYSLFHYIPISRTIKKFWEMQCPCKFWPCESH